MPLTWHSVRWWTSWFIVRLPALLVLGLAGVSVYWVCAGFVDSEHVFAEYPSPDRKHKVSISAGDEGALGYSDVSVSIIDTTKTIASPCRVLSTDHHGFSDGSGPIDVKWIDDSKVVLTYPARREVRGIVARCPGVDVDHVFAEDERALRGYVCLDAGEETFQPCDEARRDHWRLKEANRVAGWAAVRANAHPVAPTMVPTPFCRSERVYVELDGVVRPRGDAGTPGDAGEPAVEIVPTRLLYEAPVPRGSCSQYP